LRISFHFIYSFSKRLRKRVTIVDLRMNERGGDGLSSGKVESVTRYNHVAGLLCSLSMAFILTIKIRMNNIFSIYSLFRAFGKVSQLCQRMFCDLLEVPILIVFFSTLYFVK